MELVMWFQRLLKIYYLATPLFFLGDQFGGVSVRVAGLDAYPVFKYAYYAGCMGIGAATHFFPKKANLLSLLECVTNIIILVLSIMLPILQVMDSLSNNQEPVLLGMKHVANFLISGTFLTVAFYQNPLVGVIPESNKKDSQTLS
jgi:hypothetical protein